MTNRLITREELKEKLDRGDDFKLVMALGEWHFRAVHIPGSLSVSSAAEIAEKLDPNDEIVVYCTDRACPASKLLYMTLVRAGYERVRRYPDGVYGWQEGGYPLEGDQVDRASARASERLRPALSGSTHHGGW